MLLQLFGAATVASPLTALAQGRCFRTFGSPACNTSPIPAVFAPTGWRTVSLDHLAIDVADYQKEAAFYAALMGWKLQTVESELKKRGMTPIAEHDGKGFESFRVKDLDGFDSYVTKENRLALPNAVRPKPSSGAWSRSTTRFAIT